MHRSETSSAKQDIDSAKQDIGGGKQDIDSAKQDIGGGKQDIGTALSPHQQKQFEKILNEEDLKANGSPICLA